MGLMPVGGKGKQPYERLHVGVPSGLFMEATKVVEYEGKWMSLADFVREAIKEKVERWKKEHPLGLPPPQR